MAAFPINGNGNGHGKARLSLFTLFSLFLLTHSSLTLNLSDLKALSTLQNNLGLNAHHYLSAKPCNTPGVFCERRLSNNSIHELRVTRLVFDSRSLDGFLSPLIARLSELKELSLPNNQLVNRLPSQIVDCRKLEILNLRNNRFSGEITRELSSLVRLRVLDLASNKFSGDLGFLKYFPNLENLSIADNLFTGKVPASVRSYRNLRFFNFSGNPFLEGSAPLMNRLEYSASDVPKRRYILSDNLTRRSVSNSAVAPSPSRIAPSDAPAPSPAASARNHKKNHRKLTGWILGFLAGGLAGSISGFIFSLMFKLILAVVRSGGKEPGPSIYSPLIKKAEHLAFLEKEDGLTSLEIIGRGGCGEVYKAELPGSDGKMIAIKKITQPPKDTAELTDEDSKLLNKKMRQIRSEINTVGQIRHRNLLPLLAHLSRPDCHLLVYEFMKNGSLQDMLHDVSQGNKELDWLARHRIALGVAAGLEYLHLHHSPRIIHRDLKPANILLDDDMEARIADFGLAKAMPDANTHISTSNVAGTVGYIAPEYHQTLKFTDKCDVYSFGVMLGVLVMGKLPSDQFFQETNEMSLVKWMSNVMTSENPKQAIDPKLLGNGFEDQMLLVLKIACFCTLGDPKQRPNSKDVRCMLSQIKH
ncbi:leucine-rich repeat receptor-like serine/threonine/tyrosine-protein kinase SOBIR1 [Juglans microcarpa x Juglans regia]|uniref:leucine-rich repeat receptor-like serine/threonine/tyrosine-protein kinase SOBIR1 n=1 Tax=Juglans microcarpa x Juglans regia TaxID=2249226 RepID=UPI001B7E8214|nr:leucine-rich repeat receptor-like serine/threonine/tyrosine-protein kinase SOBIR1 [Juglans microcarpa x Juglans regia]